ncbi:MAG: hypothetical protein JSU07_11585 [Bacteroidetes bacterium]|nr:hypothetical protein [Bacteroidota bacterium]
MKLFFITLTTALALASCGPAAEDKAASDARNKIIQDSLTAVIKAHMAEPLTIINSPVQTAPMQEQTAPTTSTVK